MNLCEIVKLAAAFRCAIEQTDQSSLITTLKNFPNGSCGDAALLLGTFLKAQGAGSFQYVLGYRGEGSQRHSHAWIEQDGLLVDITADQFSEINDRVIVSYCSDWHSAFNRTYEHEADYHIYYEADPNAAQYLRHAYLNITANLDHASTYTMHLYDSRHDDVTLDAVKRIGI